MEMLVLDSRLTELCPEELLVVDGGGAAGDLFYDLGYAAYNFVQKVKEVRNEFKEIKGPNQYPKGDCRNSDWYKNTVLGGQ